MSGEATGHDWWHVYRVWQLSKRINKSEKGDPLVVELAALLHDIDDWKFNGGDLEAGPQAARQWLARQKVEPDVIKHVGDIITHLPFKGARVQNRIGSLEGKIVQVADRLDALGAIGIARAFAYGGYKKRAI